jgi:hypothetical protein
MGVAMPFAEHSLTYELDAEVVANAVISAIQTLGEVTFVSRETGRIQATLGRRKGLMAKLIVSFALTVEIQKTGQGTKVDLHLKSNGFHETVVRKAMAGLLEAIGAQSALQGHSKSGW